jgi:hypothetical protein
MATNNLIPLFLSDHTEEPERPVIGKAWHRAAISSRIIKTIILVVTAAAIVFAIRLVGNPLVLFTNARASLFATSAPQDGTGQSTPRIQSTADAQVLPPTASKAPTGDEIATTPKTADQSQTDIRQPSVEVSLNQFQAWATEEDARAQVRPVQPVQDAQAQAGQTAPEQVRPAQKRQVRPAQNARAKIVKNTRGQLRRVRNARAQVRPEQNPEAQDRSAQDAQAPGFLQSLGLRN